jgi:uracil-DNA glycosylase
MPSRLDLLLSEIRACERCADQLPHEPRPVLVARRSAHILVAGQAPGRKVHESGQAWNDASGERLRHWMGVDREQFYDARRIAIVPMGFCFPGSGSGGDLPPRPECRATWHDRLFALLPGLRLRIVIGAYAHVYHLGNRRRATLTQTVAAWRDWSPEVFALPHPSPRNQLWLRRNPWFEHEVVPELRAAVRRVLSA